MMKRLLFLLLLCLSLWGCAAHAPAPEENPVISGEEEILPVFLPVTLYDPDSAIEAETAGAVKAYPLAHMEPTGLFVMSDALVLIGESDGGTLLQRLSGETLTVDNSLYLNVSLSPEEGYFQGFSDRLVYYDPMTLQIVVLSPTLQALERISVPMDLMGTPLLSRDGSTLYYCTRDAIRALELSSGISRLLKEISCTYQTVSALHLKDSLLQCSLWDAQDREKTMILSTENGRLVYETEGHMTLSASADRYYAHLSSGSGETLLFGNIQESPRMLEPGCAGSFFRFLPDSHGAVSAVPSGDPVQLLFYDLHSGRQTSAFRIPGGILPKTVVDGGNGILWILGHDGNCPTLYRWDTALLPTGSNAVFTGSYSTRESPDPVELEKCRQYAQTIGEAYGVEIRIYTDALLSLPEGCDLEYEHQPHLLMERLKLLETQLETLPREIPETLSSQYSGLRISLVRSITPNAAAELPENPQGLSFWDGTTACITLAAGQQETAFYNALFQLMDTVIHTRSSAFDRWEDLNPMRFSYTYSYGESVPEEYEKYLHPDNRAFLDKGSMTFPKEERARIFEYAMTPEKECFFHSLTMQKKLTTLCQGIRSAFGLKKAQEIFPWEQYLNPQ